MHREAIGSVLAQTFKDYELIVIDDGSTDDTQEVLASYGSRLKVLRQPNSGPETARHNGARYAQGEYIVFRDSDDLLCSGALEAYDHVINECSSPPLIIGSWTEFEDGSPLPPEDQHQTRQYRSVRVQRFSLSRYPHGFIQQPYRHSESHFGKTWWPAKNGTKFTSRRFPHLPRDRNREPVHCRP
jgi:glycosyltransferase involved in cell wall biosynthesis